MVLNYQIPSDVLANDEVTRRKIELAVPKEPHSKLKKTAKFCILLVADIMVLILVCNIWASEQKDRSVLDHLKPVWQNLTTNTGAVTAISFNTQNPTAIVYGKIVHEGDEVKGSKVLKIYPDAVELRTKGKTVLKKLH
ncbi:MAG: hypothetical protein ACYS18_09315 [Planctomycetota bacterium]|jgi:hypothetical protein